MPEGNSPAFIAFCAGVAFLFAGLTCMVRARAGMTDMQSEVPDGAPGWTKVSYRVLAIGTAGALATIGSWIAIARAPRLQPVGAARRDADHRRNVGRTVFGLGAVIVWIYVIALSGTVRKLFDRHGG